MNKERLYSFAVEQNITKKKEELTVSGNGSSWRIAANRTTLFSCNIYQSPACCAVAEVGSLQINPPCNPQFAEACLDFVLNTITNRSSVYVNSNGAQGIPILEAALALRPDFIKLPKHKNPNTRRVISQYFKILRNRV